MGGEASGKGQQGQAVTALSGVQIQTSNYGIPIPIIYGWNRATGNLVWYGNFSASPQSSGGGKGGGGSSPSSYSYSAAGIIGLCEGGNYYGNYAQRGGSIGVGTVWSSKDITNLANLNMSFSTGWSNNPSYPQPIWPWLQTNFPAQALAYPNIAAVYSSSFQLSDSAQMPNISYEMQGQMVYGPITALSVPITGISGSTLTATAHGFVQNQCINIGSTGTYPNTTVGPLSAGFILYVCNVSPNAFQVAGFPQQLGSTTNTPVFSCTGSGSGILTAYPFIQGAAPADIIDDYLTNSRYGVNAGNQLINGSLIPFTFPVAPLNDATFTTGAPFHQYCVANGIFLSPALTTQDTAANFINTICDICNSAPVWSQGTLKIIPYGDQPITGNNVTFTPNTTPEYNLGDDDFLSDGSTDPVIVTRTDPADAFNQVQVNFSDRTAQYNTNVAQAQDQANIDLYGLRAQQPYSYDYITDNVVARNVAQVKLQRLLYMRNQYTFKLGWNYARLEPMDLVTLTDSTLGLYNHVVRITEVEEDTDEQLSIIAEDWIGGNASATAYPHQTNNGYQTLFNADPGLSNPPVIFDAPGVLTTTGHELWMATSGGAQWGGAEVWVSTDNTTYLLAGTISTPSRYGVLSGSVPAGSDPDITDTIGINLSVSGGVISNAQPADADNLTTLALINDSGNVEVIAYSTATLTGSHQYNLSNYIRRGLYGTSKAAHASGVPFVRLDDAIFKYPYSSAWAGKTIYVKLVPFNLYGASQYTLAMIGPSSYVLGNPTGAPSDVTGFIFTVNADYSVLLTWNQVTDSDLNDYGICQGAGWNADVTWVSGTSYLVPPETSLNTVDFFIRARSVSGTLSVGIATVVANTQAAYNKTAAMWAATLASPILTATGGLFMVSLSWIFADARTNIVDTEIWWSSSNDITTATRITQELFPSSTYDHVGLSPGESCNYWARVVDVYGNISPWSPSVYAVPSTDPTALLKQLVGSLGLAQLATTLAEPIASITWDQLTQQIGLHATQVVNSGATLATTSNAAVASAQSAVAAVNTAGLQAGVSAVTQTVSNVVNNVENINNNLTNVVENVSNLSTNVTNVSNAVTNVSNTVTNVSNIVNDPVTGLAATVTLAQSTAATAANANLSAQNQIATILSQVNDPVSGLQATNALVQSNASTAATATAAFAGQIETIQALVNNPTTGMAATSALVQQNQTAQATVNSATAASVTTLSAQVNNPTTGLAATIATVLTQQTAQATTNAATASSISTLSSQVNSPTSGLAAAIAAIQTQAATQASINSSTATLISTLTSSISDPATGVPAALALMETNAATVASATEALTTSITTLSAQVNNATTGLPATLALVNSSNTAQATVNTATATSLSTLSATVNNPTTGLAATLALVQTTNIAQATVNSATASSITNIQSTWSGQLAAVQSSYSTQASALTGLSATYTLRAQANGAFASMQLGSSSTTGSAVIFESDKFEILNGAGTGMPVFMIDALTGNVGINGNLIVAGNLSSISATLGTVTAGYLQNTSNTNYVNLNATGTQTFLQVGSNASINANGVATFNQVIITRNLVLATGSAVGLAGTYSIGAGSNAVGGRWANQTTPGGGWSFMGKVTVDTGYACDSWWTNTDEVFIGSAGIPAGTISASSSGSFGTFVCDWMCKVTSVYPCERWNTAASILMDIELWAVADGNVNQLTFPAPSWSLYKVT